MDEPAKSDRLSDEKMLMPLPIGPVDRYGRNRDAEAARLKAMGWTLRRIAAHLGLGDDERRAAAAIKRAMARAVRFANDETRALELQSYDELEAQCWRVLQNEHVVFQNGKVVLYDGSPIDDDRFVLETIDRILKIKERRARLLGLDAPTKAEITTIDSVEAEIAKLERELAESRRNNLT